MTTPMLRIICLASLALLAGCATETTQRAAFGTLQNIGQQACEKGSPHDCTQRDSYDQYQRDRQKLGNE